MIYWEVVFLTKNVFYGTFSVLSFQTPRWPTPNGLTEIEVRKICQAAINASASIQSCIGEVSAALSITQDVNSCVTDIQVTANKQLVL